MKVLTFGLDNSILDKNSLLSKRTLDYGELVEKYTIIVPNSKNVVLEISEKIKAYGVAGGNKLNQLLNIYNLAKKILKQENYSLISVQDPYFLAVIGLRLRKKYNLGLELQIHGWEKFNGIRKIIANFSIKNANSLRVVSQRLKRQLIEQFNVNEKKITVVPIFSDLTPTSAIEPKRSRVGEKKNNFIFLTVGRLVPVKNIKLQIEAMAEVVKKYFKTELYIIGEGLEQSKLEKLCVTLNITHQVKFFGKQDMLDDYYNMADAFMLTSDYEGWGLVVIEAASFGLPIIMTDVGCAGEVIKDSESGLIIPIGDKQKLVEAMLKIITDKNLKEMLGSNARSAVSHLPNKQETLELYKKSWEIALDRKI
jgi:glycosyltransferase involved in cell wall biosynthesis